MKKPIALEVAVRLMEEKALPLWPEWVPVSQARGRTLAVEAVAPISQPPFARSPLDGYALRAMDLVEASQEKPVRLDLIGASLPGRASDIWLRAGQAVKVMAGSMLPKGADCVIGQEESAEEAGTITVKRSLRAQENYCYKGQEYQEGETLLPANTRIDAAAVGLLLGAGIMEVVVKRRPVVYLLEIGDDLLLPQFGPLPSGKTYAANGSMLKARIEELGIASCSYQKVGNDFGTISELLFIAAEKNDLVITIGDLSANGGDTLSKVLAKIGAKQVYRDVEMDPGGPVMFSTHYAKPVLSLSGHPPAALLQFELLARPLLAAMTGEAHLLPRRATAARKGTLPQAGKARMFVRGRYQNGVVTVSAPSTMGQLQSYVGCNCLVDIPAGDAAAGGQVDVILLSI